MRLDLATVVPGDVTQTGFQDGATTLEHYNDVTGAPRRLRSLATWRWLADSPHK